MYHIKITLQDHTKSTHHVNDTNHSKPHAKPHEATKTMLNYAKPRETMRNYAKTRKTTRDH